MGQTNQGHNVMATEDADGPRESGDPTESTGEENSESTEPEGSGAQATPSESVTVT